MYDQSSQDPTWYTYSYTPPDDYWKSSAANFVGTCRAHLWSRSRVAQAARDALKKRGFSSDIIKTASVGINPEGHHRDRSKWWGPDLFDNRMWVPRGFVLPWADNDRFSRIYIRRPGSEVDREADDPEKRKRGKYIAEIKYKHVPRKAPLFGLQWVETESPIVLVEQEFDALAIQDAAGDVCSAVATGHPKGARREDWRQLLSGAPAVLVAFDTSDAGQDAATAWMDALPNAHRWKTYIDDRDERMEPGKQLRDWLQEGLHAVENVRKK